MGRILRMLGAASAASRTSQISPLAYVAPWVTFGEGCVVHPFAVIGRLPSQSKALRRTPATVRELFIGPNTEIGPHAVIYGGATIGSDCLIGDHASIREDSIIGDRCIIGRSVTVNYDATLSNDVRLQDGTHITGGMKIGRNSFFGVGVVTSNDRRLNLSDYRYKGAEAPYVGENVMIGSGANILAGVTIGDWSIVGAGAVVTTDVAAKCRVMGPKAVER